MKTLRIFFRRLVSFARPGRDEERMRIEMEGHLELQTSENIRCGLAPGEARRQAVLKFGAMEAMRETYRDQRSLPWLETLLQDTRQALRRLRLAPAFTLATMLTLALGIGATTSIFTLVHAVLLKSLPVAKPAELYRVGRESRCCYQGGYSQEKEFSLVSYDLYKFLRDQTAGFAELAAFPAFSPLFGVRRAGKAELAQSYPGEFVSGNYFRMFGIGAYAGRMLTPEDDRPGVRPVAVMSYGLWQRRYASDPTVVGSVFDMNGRPFTVVGITPPGFFGDTLRSTPPDLFLPLNAEPLVEADGDLNKHDLHWLALIGRITPGTANVAAVEAGMRVALRQWLQSHWGEMSAGDRAKFPQQTLYLRPGGAGISNMREQYERWLQILMVVAGFVLLIVCANVANLMLLRGLERRREISLSMALGARPGRVIRQALTESVVLSLLGGAAGLGVAFAGTRLILRFAFPSLPGFAGVPIEASPSAAVLLFASGVSILTGLVFGIAPAWMAARVAPIEALRGAGRAAAPAGDGARAGSLPRKTLVVLQAALSLVLLSAAGLLTSALQRLERQEFGFEQEGRIVVNINPRLAGYRTEQLPLLYRRIHDSVAAIPGVAGVALCLTSPQRPGGWGSAVWVEGRPEPGPAEDNSASWDRVTAGYLEVVGNRMARGRGISAQDTAGSRPVAVINEAFARKFFRDEAPIGRRFGRERGASRELEVVGVAKDARYRTDRPGEPVGPFFFVAAEQADYTRSTQGALFLQDIVAAMRPGAGTPIAQVRQAVAAVDAAMPVISIRTLREQVTSQFAQQRLMARLTSLFGFLSLVLASVGIYGVTAYNASLRVSEIGIRMAVGADRSGIVRLVLRGAFGLILPGLGIGLPLTLAVGRFLGSRLSGIHPYDPAVAAVAVTALGLSALIATLAPAVRASRLSPLEALRGE